MSTTQITTVETGCQVRLPAEWAADLGLGKFAALEKRNDGILIRPVPAATWDDVFSTKLSIGSTSSHPETLEMSGDDLLF